MAKDNDSPLSSIFNEQTISTWIKSLESFIDKSFEHYASFVDHLSFPLDVHETRTEYIATARLDGYDQKQIQIEVLDRALRVIAFATESTKLTNESTSLTSANQSHKRVERLIPLPFELTTEDVTATFQDGLLKIRIKKKLPTSHYIDIQEEE
ncbi:heat shock protein Hsp20 [Fictibacillus macauensis ZFHKF-1]|uniref:Heat shock protein Hsp20 n=1 Tax=Fictibacillus macauensis ZFHKF-1 TaxID=1196324 RepID=I8UD31_9BACL|nr:Hsp20/alpha crystallin family protein [Fictibacillus macauensis]EIT84713.1 heat shock protein Hsp20 [Fictibacillus macauensis ZFHKF-1]